MKRFFVLLLIPAILLGVSFKDLNPKHWAYEAVVKLAEMGIITGYPDGTFRGKDPVSRYQLAMALYRLVKYIDEKVSALPAPSSGAGTVDRRLEAKISNLEKLVSDLRRRVAILEKGRGEEGTNGEEISNLESMIKKAFELISKNTSSMKDLKSSIDELSRTQEGLQSEFAEMKLRIDELTKDLSNLSNRLNELRNLKEKLNTLNDAFSALKDDIREYIDEKLTEKGGATDMDYLKTIVNANASSIEEIKGEVEKLKEMMSKLEEIKIEVSKGDLEGVKERLAKVEKVTEEIANLKGKVENLEKRLDGIENTVETLKDVGSEISSVKNEMENLRSEVSTIRSDMENLKETLSAMTNSQKDHEKKVADLEKRLKSLEDENESLKKNLEGLKEKESEIPGWGKMMIFLVLLNLVIGGYALYVVLTGGSGSNG